MQTNNPEATQDSSNKQAQNTGRWKLLAVVAVCAFPIIASYFTYYIIKPTGRNNYGAPAGAIQGQVGDAANGTVRLPGGVQETAV